MFVWLVWARLGRLGSSGSSGLVWLVWARLGRLGSSGSSGVVWTVEEQNLKDKLSYHSRWPILNYRVLSYDMCVRSERLGLAVLTNSGIR
jgi:hypothetical protein